jgi:hypothetical protein
MGILLYHGCQLTENSRARQTGTRRLALEKPDYTLRKLAGALRDHARVDELRPKTPHSGSCCYQRLAMVKRFYCFHRKACPEHNGIDYHGRSVR